MPQGVDQYRTSSCGGMSCSDRTGPNAGKCWLVRKPDKEETARSIFEETAINITTEGRKHLGAALGSRSYLEQYVNGKVEEWVEQVTNFAAAPGLLRSVHLWIKTSLDILSNDPA